MRVLIADDDMSARKMLELMLGKLGYQVDVVANGAAALEVLCGEDPPDLAILDWEMPRLNGDLVCRSLRARPDAPPVYIMLLTSNSDSKYVVHGLEAGADDFLIKPFNVNEIGARLRVGTKTVALRRNLAEARAEVARLQTALGAAGIEPVIASAPPPLPARAARVA